MKYSNYVIILAFLSMLFISSCSDDSNPLDSNFIKDKYLNIDSVIKSDDSTKPHDFYWYDGTVKSFLNETKGKVVVLNFWASWCGPCVKELPDLIKISQDYKSKGVVVIGVNLDIKPGSFVKDIPQLKDVMKDKLKNNSFNYINFIDVNSRLSYYYSVVPIPTTFFIDKNGKIFQKIEGSMEYNTFKLFIDKLLK